MKKIMWGLALLSFTVLALTPFVTRAEDAVMEETVKEQAEEKHRDVKEDMKEGEEATGDAADEAKADGADKTGAAAEEAAAAE